MLRKAKRISSAERNTMWSRDADVTQTQGSRPQMIVASSQRKWFHTGFRTSNSNSGSSPTAILVNYCLHEQFLVAMQVFA
jgi:hypothetical protein